MAAVDLHDPDTDRWLAGVPLSRLLRIHLRIWLEQRSMTAGTVLASALGLLSTVIAISTMPAAVTTVAVAHRFASWAQMYVAAWLAIGAFAGAAPFRSRWAVMALALAPRRPRWLAACYGSVLAWALAATAVFTVLAGIATAIALAHGGPQRPAAVPLTMKLVAKAGASKDAAETPNKPTLHGTLPKTKAATVVPNAAANNGYVAFNTTGNQSVLAKVGVSYVSAANAQANLAAETPNWDFAGTRSAAHAAWNTLLSRAQIGGGTNTQQQQQEYHTALYHSLLHPNVNAHAALNAAIREGLIHRRGIALLTRPSDSARSRTQPVYCTRISSRLT